MSISYQSKDDKVLSVALKVQELCVTVKDSIVSVGANTVIDVGEDVAEVRAVMHIDPVGGTVAAVPSTVSGSEITATGLVLAAGESLVVKYVIAE